jgi:ABC-type multidrug transport system ATPase subunit
MSRLSVENLCVQLGGAKVLDTIDFAPGEGWSGVLGANGSGKTTLLRCIAGRLPVGSGTILLDGEDVSNSQARRAELVGFAPPLETLPNLLTVREIIVLSAAAHRTEPRLKGDLFDALGIASLLNRKVEVLSSGNRQRVSNFLAFNGNPTVVLLDEPFNWLDPVAIFDFKNVLKKMSVDGLTVITTLHDIASFIGLCDGGLVLRDGKVIFSYASRSLLISAGDPSILEREIYAAMSSPS